MGERIGENDALPLLCRLGLHRFRGPGCEPFFGALFEPFCLRGCGRPRVIPPTTTERDDNVKDMLTLHVHWYPRRSARHQWTGTDPIPSGEILTRTCRCGKEKVVSGMWFER